MYIWNGRRSGLLLVTVLFSLCSFAAVFIQGPEIKVGTFRSPFSRKSLHPPCPERKDNTLGSKLTAPKSLIISAMLKVIDEAMSTAQPPVPYWISDGTALGAVRLGGLIPHDNDADITVSEDHIRTGRFYDRLRSHIDHNYPGLFALVKNGPVDWKNFSTQLHVLPGHLENPDPWYTEEATPDIPMRVFPRAQKGLCAGNGTLLQGLCYHFLDIHKMANAAGFLRKHGGLCETMFEGRPLTCLVDAQKYLLELYGTNWSTPDERGSTASIPCPGWEEAWLVNEERLKFLARTASGVRNSGREVIIKGKFPSLHLRDCESLEHPWHHVNQNYE